jgi:hypothetical protein
VPILPAVPRNASRADLYERLKQLFQPTVGNFNLVGPRSHMASTVAWHADNALAGLLPPLDRFDGVSLSPVEPPIGLADAAGAPAVSFSPQQWACHGASAL